MSATPLQLSADQKYRAFLEGFAAELERRHPGVFQWRIGKPSESVVEGVIITKDGVEGYIFVVGSCRWDGGTAGGIWRDDGEHSYSASAMAQREWELPKTSHWMIRYLESRCSADAGELIDSIVQEWAFERPWRAPPAIDPKAERKRLQRIVDGLETRSQLPVIVEANPGSEHKLTPEGEALLTRDLEGLSPKCIRSEFPADHRGAVSLNTTVVLSFCATASPPARDRVIALAAVGPKRRSDPQEIRIRLESLIPENQDHVWDRERWRWHSNSANTPNEVRWGAPIPVEALSQGSLTTAELMAKRETGSLDPGHKAALAILLQDDGRLIEALELYGIEITQELNRLCGGQKIYPPACCAHADEKWMALFHEWMRACAPWKIESATRNEADRIAAWAGRLKHRKRRLPILKLLIFPGQHHIRKACLVLTSKNIDGTGPRLEIQALGTNARLHESAWTRPREIDVARFQLR